MSRAAPLLLLLVLLARSHAGEEGKPAEGAKPLTGNEAEHDAGRKPNRLAKEKSPYLLQHRFNPVDWYPWGPEAFEKAKREDKPIFLSIGYSTCHWCHVMERESFENEEIAALMNERFVSIKVDREERPDVDQIYMAAVQAMTGSGGWPLSVALDHEGRPFWGGTYFPPDDRFGRPGFATVLTKLSEYWRTRREEVLANAGKVADHLRTVQTATREAEVGAATLARGLDEAAARFDEKHGGFETRPKFPRTHLLSFLLRQGSRGGDDRAARMAAMTLTEMWRGGVYDHVGGGFHRYSTDERWLVPHFEKMLYDQAIVVRALVETWQVTGDDLFAEIARDVIRYVLRDMTDEGGGFCSAEDADSEGEEGKFYVWTRDEIAQLLGEADGSLFADVYGAKPEGNWIEESSGERMETNILHLPRPLADAAKAHGLSEAELRAKLAPMREKLFAVREKRVHPLKDDKVLTDWNGLMIGALAYAGAALGDETYVAAAEKAADFVLSKMVDDGRLLHRYREGSAAIPAFLDDHAFLSHGLLELYEATLDPRWLREAKRLAGEMVDLFEDAEGGGFFFSAADGEKLVSRSKEVYDGAIPSGNSVAAWTLVRLGRLTMDERLSKAGERTVRTFSGHLERMPTGFPVMLMALDCLVGPAREITIAGAPADAAPMLAEVRRRFLPRTVLAGNPGGDAARAVAEVVPFVAEQKPVDGKATAYVCEGYACKQPVTSVEELRALLDE